MITESMLTIAEAADATGLTHKAMRNRVDRGQVEYVLQNGVRRIPRSELLRVGLLSDSGDPIASHDEAAERGQQQRTSPRPGERPRADMDALVDRLHDRLEQQAIELGRAQIVIQQHQESAADDIANIQSTVHTLELELRLVRAELANAENRITVLENARRIDESPHRRRWLGRRSKDTHGDAALPVRADQSD